MSRIKIFTSLLVIMSAVAVTAVEFGLLGSNDSRSFPIIKIIVLSFFLISLLFNAILDFAPWLSANEAEVKKIINIALDSSTSVFSFLAKKRVRACVFLPENKDPSKMGIRYYSTNMEAAADLGIRFEKWQGCVGKAWGYETGIIGIFGKLTQKQEWSITEEQYALTIGIKYVRTEPIFLENNGNKRIIGILSYDSTDDISELFQDDRFIDFAGEMAKVIGNLLINAKLIKPSK